ncbi:MAG: peptidylprolyl isomerase [Clostridia bacterium]|nr:peptidylprolyl isomerase [Clostridia bacterium]
MKRTGKFVKILSLVLCAAMLMLALASCGKGDSVLTFTADGKEYTLTESEFDFMMMYRKYQIFYANNYPSAYDEFLWQDSEVDSELKQVIVDTAKTVVVEKYLMEKFGLELDEKEVKELKDEYKATIKGIGGQGAFKANYGWTADQMMQYDLAIKNNTLIRDYLYNTETGVEKVTDEELDAYYNENFKQYQLIMISTTQDVSKDADGKKEYVVYDKNGKEVTVTDISEESLKEKEYSIAYTYKYVDLEDGSERKEEKIALVDEILSELKDGADFKELALKYSDEFLTEYFEDGYILEGDLINDEDAIEAINKLEVGDYTEKAISLDSGKYYYIVKRVALADKAYTHADEGAENTEYADLFENFDSTVADSKYEKFLEEYINAVVVNEDILAEYSMATTKLSPMIKKMIG